MNIFNPLNDTVPSRINIIIGWFEEYWIVISILYFYLFELKNFWETITASLRNSCKVKQLKLRCCSRAGKYLHKHGVKYLFWSAQQRPDWESLFPADCLFGSIQHSGGKIRKIVLCILVTLVRINRRKFNLIFIFSC